MNNLDKQYTDLLQDILINGVVKSDRTGTGTISIFGRQIRHKMSEGFPLLTTKKMPFKTIATELLWFLRGDTNIKFLVDNNCHIWDGDAYKNYLSKVQNYADSLSVPDDISEFKGVIDSLNKQIKSSVLTQEEFINKIKTDDKFAKTWGDLGPIYGKQWRQWSRVAGEINKGGVDQIVNLINDLKTNPDSRRLMVNAWNVGELDQMVLPPCHYGFQVYTRELSLDKRYELAGIFGKEKLPGEPSYTEEQQHSLLDELVPKRAISLMWNQRSVDTFLGLPFNIASYGLLLEIIAEAVNMVPDELIGNLGDVHLYSNHVEQAKEQIGRDGFELPTLNINTEFWPYEGGECGIGPLDAIRVFEAFKDDNFCKCLLEEDIQLSNYQSHPSIKAPLSN
jgi:thymidylate synthase